MKSANFRSNGFGCTGGGRHYKIFRPCFLHRSEGKSTVLWKSKISVCSFLFSQSVAISVLELIFPTINSRLTVYVFLCELVSVQWFCQILVSFLSKFTLAKNNAFYPHPESVLISDYCKLSKLKCNAFRWRNADLYRWEKLSCTTKIQQYSCSQLQIITV